MQQAFYKPEIARADFAEQVELSDWSGYWQILPHSKYIQMGIAVLAMHHHMWGFNCGDDGRLWHLEPGVFVAWRPAWSDFLKLLEADHPAHAAEADLAAKHLAVENLIEPLEVRSEPGPYWLCQPSNCPLLKEKGKNGGFRYMIKLRKPGLIFSELPEPIEAAFQVVSAERRAKKFDYHDF